MITKEDINLLKRFFAEKGQKVYQTISSIISWTNIAGKPLEFPPEAHTHLEADVTDLQDYALKSNVLELDNITAFTPDTDYEPATKKYVDDNSGLVGTKEVDEINIADTKILEYDSTSDKLIYVAKPTGGGTGFFNKLDAITNPTVNDDSVDGYEVGSLWFNVTTSKVFQCLNATTGAAVWVELTGSGGGIWTVDAAPALPSAYDDEFNDSNFNTTLWTEFDPNNKLALSEDIKGLQCTFESVATGSQTIGIYQPIPAGDFTIITKVMFPYMKFQNYFGGGLILWENATDTAKKMYFLLTFSNATSKGGIALSLLTNYATYNSGVATLDPGATNGAMADFYYQKIVRSSTTYYFFYSADGCSWRLLYSTSSPNFTPTYFGLGGENIVTTGYRICRFSFFRYKNTAILEDILEGRRV